MALDLKDDPQLIAEYRKYHENVWPEIEASILESGVTAMEIYLLGNRLFMVMETGEDYDPAAKAAADRDNPKVAEWEQLMWRYQQALPWARNGEKWIPMERIYSLGQD